MRYTLPDFQAQFPTHQACLAYLLDHRIGPCCGFWYQPPGRKCFVCTRCHRSVSPTAGTIFHKSSTPLVSWFYALYLFSKSKHGVSAAELQRHLGTTYKTSWRMAKLIRSLMAESGRLHGVVELDETYYGGRHYGGKRGLGAANKTPVFGMVERGGRVLTKVVRKVKKHTILPIIKRTIAKDALVITDHLRLYRNLPKIGYAHECVDHSDYEYVRGEVHTNTIEGFWSQLKRSIRGTHVAVSKKHLQSYVDSFAWTYNRRHDPSRSFYDLLERL